MDADLQKFDIAHATIENYDEIADLFNKGKVGYIGNVSGKSRTAQRFFGHYATHRLIVHKTQGDNDAIGYAEVTNFPFIPALPVDCWQDWINHHYCTRLKLTRSNTLFFNTFIFRKEYNPTMLKEVLREIFFRENKIRYIIAIECPNYKFGTDTDPPDFLCFEKFSMVFYPFCFSPISCPNTGKIHVITRDCIIPKMRYRKALPEDNDDIVNLVDVDRKDIKEQLGEFYIAEELLADDSNSLLVVTEILNLTSGFIWLNDNVNIVQLVENYDLELYGNLIQFDPKAKFKEKIFFITKAQRTHIDRLFTQKDVDKIVEEKIVTMSESSSSIDIQEDAPDPNELRNKTFRKMTVLMDTFKTYDHYIQLRRKRHAILFNIDEDRKMYAFDTRSNAFVIQMFGLTNEYDIRRLFQYLSTSFIAFPNKDYCLLSIALTQTITASLFEMLKYFMPVVPRPGCKVEELLYITHRSAVFGELSIFPARGEDIDDIKSLLSDDVEKPVITTARRTRSDRMSRVASKMSVAIFAPVPSDINTETKKRYQAEYDIKMVTKILDEIFQNPFSKYKCLTIRCGDSEKPLESNVLVGFVILRPFTSSWQLKKHFLLTCPIESPIQNVAEIMILKLHPLFHYQSDTIFRELAGLTNFWHFYYFRPIYYQYLSNDMLAYMQPLEPRRNKKLWFQKMDTGSVIPCPDDIMGYGSEIPKSTNDNSNLQSINFSHDFFHAYQNNLNSSAFFGNTMNIVVLGFSNICKAFLRLLLFSWNSLDKHNQTNSNCLPHINVTVICKPGVMEAEYESSFRCDICKDDNNCWVNYRNCDAFVRDVTQRLDIRTWVRFVSGNVSSIDKENHIIKLKSGCEIFYETLLLASYTIYGLPPNHLDPNRRPSNYVQCNNRYDKLTFYHRLRIFMREMPKDIPKSIVVYGNHIRAFEFIDFLVTHGIKGSEIKIVMPYQVENLQMGLMLNDPTIDTRIEVILRQMVEDMGVTVHDRMNLLSIQHSEDNEYIESVTFKRFLDEEELTLHCDFFASFWEKYMNDADMEIFKNANLEMEGPFLVVDENYTTSDPCIFATGNYIQFHNEPNHQYRFVNPQEAAEKIINALDINANDYADHEEKFSKPFYFQAHLPMKHYFFKVTCPKRYLANHLNNEYGFPLTTYLNGDFTRVRINTHGMIEEILVVTKTKKDYDFLKFFCGRHELLLNNLKSRWFLKDIVSFLDFFQEQWVELLMNDHFAELQILNKLLVLPASEECMKLKSDRNQRFIIMRNFCADFGVTSQLEYALLEFIRDHRSEFEADLALPEDFPLPPNEYDY